MKIGLYDVDSVNFPNLPLMKISAYHKSKGDDVEFIDYMHQYDRVYVSKVFSDEYSTMDMTCINAEEIIFGGTGFAISIENDKEVYCGEKDRPLPDEIEHIYPDYSLYPHLTKNKAYGFLTRGCCNNCGFCIVSKKEGLCSVKVANLSEWWDGQKEIVLLDANILACRERKVLLQQLIDSKARVDFTQGLDARFVTPEIAEMLKQIQTKTYHFAFDFMKNEKQILKGLKIFLDIVNPNKRQCSVYVLTNYDTTIQEDLYRVKKLQEIGIDPDIRIYRKNSLPKRHILRDMQRWCNNRIIYRSQPDFMQYIPRVDGKTIRELYFDEQGVICYGYKNV